MSEIRNPADYLCQLFQNHGLTSVVHNDWVMPNSELPAVRALWYPATLTGVLDVQAFVRDKVIIDECFAGMGEGDRGMHDALTSFTVNSFHVLLAALWGSNDPEQVNTEEWMIGSKRYVAYFGNFGIRNSDGITVHVPPSIFSEIEATIKREALTHDIHWFRLYFANVENDFTFEALKDNEIWEEGLRCLEGAAWERSSGFYSVRLFAVLRAA